MSRFILTDSAQDPQTANHYTLGLPASNPGGPKKLKGRQSANRPPPPSN
jgi:hypothetical protein